jgi:hypothetical protein
LEEVGLAFLATKFFGGQFGDEGPEAGGELKPFIFERK